VRRVTLREIAQEAGVSVSTVSLYLRGLPGVGLETQARIAASLEKLDYIPRAANNQPPRRIIGLAVERLPLPILNDLFYAEVMSGLESYASRLGFSVILSVVEGQELVDVLRNQQAEGWLILGGGNLTDAQIIAVQQVGIPFILLDNYACEHELPCVMPDNLRGGYEAVQHLVQLGHRRIAILSGPEKYKTLGDRLLGGRMAAQAAGLGADDLVVQPALSSGFPLKGYREMQAVLASGQRPTGIFAVSDKTAYGALRAIEEAGLRVPDDISVVGFDDLAGSATYGPGLTTIAVPKRALGMAAVQALIDRLAEPALPPIKTLMYTRLVVRGTTAPLHPSLVGERVAVGAQVSPASG
jgi:DNA-binding LacI/PurR family transcriptional regulator